MTLMNRRAEHPENAPKSTAQGTPAEDRAARKVAALLAPLVRSGAYLKYFDLWQEHGFHVSRNHFYEPIPDTRALPDALWEREAPLHGIDMNGAEQVRLLQEVFPRFADEYNGFAHAPAPEDPHRYYFDNPMFSGTDALVSYCMMRYAAPRRIVEVGGGFSTLLAAEAARRNGTTELVCIEPSPRPFLNARLPGLTALLEAPVQEVDPAVFAQLEAGDVLFIDSSHVARIGSDVNYLLLDVLPTLRPGVLVHLHDVFLPREYPKDWVLEQRRFWNEQYLLQAFLIYNRCFEVLFANSYMAQHHPDAMRSTFPRSPWWGGGSFWMRKHRAG